MENSLRLSEEAYQPRPNAGGTTTDAPRELSTFNVTPTNSNSRDDATREYPNNHDRSPGSNSQVDYTRESSIAHDKVTTSTSQDKYEEDAIQINNEINDGDPLLDDEKLVQGPRLAQPGDDGLNALIKVPSDQVLAKFRWGSKHRTSGRAKTGLLIQVPGRETSISLVKGGPITGNSIMYAYTSSSSSSGRTTNSFGAVGDHLSSTTKSNRWSLNALPSVKEDSSAASHESRIYHPENSALASAGANVRSPLANLLHDSIPDSIFPLLAVGEAGPLQQPVAAQIVAPSSVRTLRRRSLSDLIEPHPLLSSSARQEASNSIGTQMIAAEPTQTAPVWHRTGPPFLPGTRHTTRGVNNSFPLDEYLDPEAFTLPYGVSILTRCVLSNCMC